jgi:hypothetical protein
MRAVGFWWAPWSDRDQFPHPAHLVDPGWDPAERSTVLGYLQAGEPWLEFLSMVTCAFCGLRVGNAYLSDGVWFWPQMLAHEVDRHAVRLPDEFVAAAARGRRILARSRARGETRA